MDKLTIKQAAEMLQCSPQTIRRRIAKGEIPAQKENTEFGEVWYIPANFIQAAATTTEVVEVTRQVGVGELVELIRAQVITEIKTELDELQEGQRRIEEGQQRIENLLNERDEKLMAAIRGTQEKKKRWPWQR